MVKYVFCNDMFHNFTADTSERLVCNLLHCIFHLFCREFLKDKSALLMYTIVLSLTAYKYAPNLESLLTQQYVCVMCTLWSDNTCVFNRFYSVKNANTQLIWSSVPYSKNILQDMQSQNITRQAVTRYYKTCSHKIYKTCSHKILHVKFNIEIWILLVHTLLVAQDDTLRLIPC